VHFIFVPNAAAPSVDAALEFMGLWPRTAEGSRSTLSPSLLDSGIRLQFGRLPGDTGATVFDRREYRHPLSQIVMPSL
jgi:hypothetical protein